MAYALAEPLTQEELAALDATYVPFPQFDAWPQGFPRQLAWERRLEELEEMRVTEPQEMLDRATQVAVRAAAWDSGAIEGLYATTRGLTMTVATQAAMWEQQVPSHGDAFALFDAQLATYELVMDVATQSQPVTEAWIRRIHEELTGPQETYTVHAPGVHGRSRCHEASTSGGPITWSFRTDPATRMRLLMTQPPRCIALFNI